MVVASFACRMRSSKQREFRAAFERLLERTRGQSGCLDGRLVCDVADAELLTLVVEWADRAAYERFLVSSECCVLRGMRFMMSTPPVVVVDEVVARERTAWTDA